MVLGGVHLRTEKRSAKSGSQGSSMNASIDIGMIRSIQNATLLAREITGREKLVNRTAFVQVILWIHASLKAC